MLVGSRAEVYALSRDDETSRYVPSCKEAWITYIFFTLFISEYAINILNA